MDTSSPYKNGKLAQVRVSKQLLKQFPKFNNRSFEKNSTLAMRQFLPISEIQNNTMLEENIKPEKNLGSAVFHCQNS
jgi:hypothetical protein